MLNAPAAGWHPAAAAVESLGTFAKCVCLLATVFAATGRGLVPSNAAIASSLAADRSLTALGGSSMGVSMFSSRRPSHDTAGSQSSSARPTGTPPAAGAAEAAAAAAGVLLNEGDLAKPHKVLLQDSGTVFMWEVPGELALYFAEVTALLHFVGNRGERLKAACTYAASAAADSV
jgi:hypothetical protein